MNLNPILHDRSRFSGLYWKTAGLPKTGLLTCIFGNCGRVKSSYRTETKVELMVYEIIFNLQWFKNMISGEEVIPDYLVDMFKYVEPIYQFHVGFLKEVEQRLAMW